MQSLFPHQQASLRGQGAGVGAAGTTLIEFKTGKCDMAELPNTGGKMRVTPVKTKGTLSLLSQGGLTKVRWTDRSNNQVADEFIVFPEEVTLKKINTGKEDDRVVLLKWNNGDRRLMYWLQDKSADKDAENISKFNDLVRDPTQIQASAAPVGAEDAQWMQMLGLGAGRPTPGGSSSGAPATASATSTTTTTTTGGAAAPSFDLSALLTRSGMQPAAVPTPAPAPAPAFTPSSTGGSLTVEDMQRAMQAGAGRQAPGNLADIITAEGVLNSGAIEDPEVRAQLIALLPEGQQSEEFLEENLRSGQFRQALGTLSGALNSDNYNSVVANIGHGLDPNAGMQHLIQGDGVNAFLASVQAANPSPVAITSVTVSSEGENKEADSGEAAPTNLFGADADESKDDNRMEE